MVLLIEEDEIADGWKALITKIMNEGEEITDERGVLARELLNTVVNIRKPLGKSETDYLSNNVGINYIKIPKGYFWNDEKLEEYSKQFLDKDNLQGFVYTYGNRLRKHFQDIDQIREAINRLKNCQESMRAISITWDPTVDTINEDAPCMILVDFKVRNGKLNTTGLWRSQNVYDSWFPNAIGLTNLSLYAAQELGLKIGTLTIHSISAHIYGVNFNDVKHY